MPAALTFEWDSRDLAVWRGGKTEHALARAMRMAGNAALRAMRDATVEYVAGKKWLDPAFIRRGLKLKNPSTRTPVEDMEWVEVVSGKSIELSRYPHIQTRFGVSARVNRGAGMTRISSAFVATNRRGHEAVFVRRGRSRLPIKELRTSRLVDVMQDGEGIRMVHARAAAKFDSAFARSMRREFDKLRDSGMI